MSIPRAEDQVNQVHPYQERIIYNKRISTLEQHDAQTHFDKNPLNPPASKPFFSANISS